MMIICNRQAIITLWLIFLIDAKKVTIAITIIIYNIELPQTPWDK